MRQLGRQRMPLPRETAVELLAGISINYPARRVTVRVYSMRSSGILAKNLSTVSTSAPAARLRVESNMLMPGHLRYGDLEEAAGAADAVGRWGLLGRFDACSCRG